MHHQSAVTTHTQTTRPVSTCPSLLTTPLFSLLARFVYTNRLSRFSIAFVSAQLCSYLARMRATRQQPPAGQEIQNERQCHAMRLRALRLRHELDLIDYWQADERADTHSTSVCSVHVSTYSQQLLHNSLDLFHQKDDTILDALAPLADPHPPIFSAVPGTLPREREK